MILKIIVNKKPGTGRTGTGKNIPNSLTVD